jgi:hypothetical protein
MPVFNNALAGAAGQAGGGAAGYTIERSLRFNDGDTPRLSRTAGTGGSQQTWTWSAWVKRTQASFSRQMAHGGDASTYTSLSFLSGGNLNLSCRITNLNVGNVTTTAQFEDFSAWYHIVYAFDAANTTTTDRIKIYVNGVEQTLSHNTAVGNGAHGFNKANTTQFIGTNGSSYFDGYMAEIYFVDGQTLAASDFGEYDDNNVWQPKEYEGTYGTNGYHLDFSDNSSTSALGTDSSGNGNTWTVTNFSVTVGAGNDSMIDSPTNYTASSGNNGGNYCTWNPLDKVAAVTLANGNLDMTQSAAGGVKGTIGVTSGKWYWEITKGSTANQVYGVATSDAVPTTYSGGYPGSCGWATGTGIVYANASGIFTKANTAAIGTASVGTVLGFALDLDSAQRTLKFYYNGNLITTNHIEIADSDLAVHPLIGTNVADSGANVANFGQRPFEYTPPAGHLSLCTTNLPDPTIEDGSTAMDTALYQGGVSPVVSGLKFEPDLIWLKSRTSGGSTSNNWVAVDSVRAANDYGYKNIYPNLTDAEFEPTGASDASVTAINSDGFDLGGNDNTNWSTSATYASWSWDAGSSTVTNTEGSIDSTVRANPSAGFSIVTYTGTGSVETVGHGLNAAPSFILVKRLSSAQSWPVYHKTVGANSYLLLDPDPNFGASSTAGAWNNTAPDSSVFTLGSGTGTNTNLADHVAYCWAPVEGYSAFGSYEGTGVAAGHFVYTGFRPAFVMMKNMDGPDRWNLFDSKRIGYNSSNRPSFPNLNNTEAGDGFLDIFSNGFKIINSSTILNSNNETHVYVAFAEHPFKTARAR